MKKILYRLQSYYQHQASLAEKNVLRYILDHPREVAEMDIHKLAKLSYSSAATIVRICQKNGFRGFKAVKIALLNDLSLSDEIFRKQVSDIADNDIDKIVQVVLNKSIDAIKNTYNLIDYTQLNKIIALIDEAKVIRLFGIGASFLVCKDFQQKLERINKLSVLYEDTHMQKISASSCKQGDLAFVVSYSGQTKEILEIANLLKANGACLISLTRYDHNSLMTLANYNLFVPALEEVQRVSAGSSRISQLSVVDIIYSAYIEQRANRLANRIVETGQLFSKSENN